MRSVLERLNSFTLEFMIRSAMESASEKDWKLALARDEVIRQVAQPYSRQ